MLFVGGHVIRRGYPHSNVYPQSEIEESSLRLCNEKSAIR